MSAKVTPTPEGLLAATFYLIITNAARAIEFQAS